MNKLDRAQPSEPHGAMSIAGGPLSIAVTGGAGFIGSHLCDALVSRGHAVVCLDNLQTGRAENIARLMGTRRFRFVRHDVVEPLPADLPRFDQIYNLACPASPLHYQEDPVRTALTCALGARHALEGAKRNGARLFHASTSEIYGDPEVHPQTEDYNGNVNCVGPRSCYDEGKRFAETLVTDFARQQGLSVKIARIFNTYGPRMQLGDGRVVSNLIVQALRGEDLTIYGDGGQTRSFCYIDDLVDGFLRLMASDDETQGPVNLGNPVECTVLELAQRVLAMTGSRSRIVFGALPVDDPRRRRPDISRARAALGWEPSTSLAEGLERTILYFEQEIASELGAKRALA